MTRVRIASRVFALGAVAFLIGSWVFGGPLDLAMMWVVAAILLVTAVVVVDAVRGRRES